MKNIATGGVLERIRRLAPPHVTAPFRTVAEWREWQLAEGLKRSEEINRLNRQLRVEKILNRSGIQPLHRKCSFANYQVQNDGQRYALSQAKSIADELMTGCTNFAFSGKPGTGKNHLAAAIGNPTIEVPEARHAINTNIFSTLVPNQQAVNVMFCDMAAPMEIPSPMPDGGLTTLYTMRATPGWNFRPEGITLLSAKYA